MTQTNDTIRTRSVKDCYICGTQGELLYQDLTDRIFSAPGEWTLKKCPNLECGLVWLDPMPLKEDIAVAYYNYYTHSESSYISDSFLQRVYCSAREGYLARKYGYKSEVIPVWKKLLGMLLYIHPGGRAQTDSSVMYLPADTEGLLLDVGCGSGEFLKRMEEMGYQVEGTEVDSCAVENARSKGLQVRLGTVEELLYPDNYFGVIVMSHVIEHVHDPTELLKECYRILKPGGKLVLVTPNVSSLMHRFFGPSWPALDPPRHLYIFNPPSLRRLVEEANFEGLRIHTTILGTRWLFQASQSIRHSGKYIWQSQQPIGLRILSRAVELAESLMLKLSPSLGEEISLVGEK